MSNATEPAGIDLKDSERTFIVEWADGEATRVPYRTLRLACVCASCVHEITGEQLLDPATVPEDVGVDPLSNKVYLSCRAGLRVVDPVSGLIDSTTESRSSG